MIQLGLNLHLFLSLPRFILCSKSLNKVSWFVIWWISCEFPPFFSSDHPQRLSNLNLGFQLPRIYLPRFHPSPSNSNLISTPSLTSFLNCLIYLAFSIEFLSSKVSHQWWILFPNYLQDLGHDWYSLCYYVS